MALPKSKSPPICFKMLEKAIPRKDYKVYSNNDLIGSVSSGTFSIGLNQGIGLAFIDSKYTSPKALISLAPLEKKPLLSC